MIIETLIFELVSGRHNLLGFTLNIIKSIRISQSHLFPRPKSNEPRSNLGQPCTSCKSSVKGNYLFENRINFLKIKPSSVKTIFYLYSTLLQHIFGIFHFPNMSHKNILKAYF